MTNPTRKTRRQVFAALLLTAAPVAIRGHRDKTDGLSVEFATIAELQSWLHGEGLDTPDLLTGETASVTDEGRPYRSVRAYPTWHGWEIFASATDYTDPAPLDDTTAAGLVAVADTGVSR